jgi:hypothetical protein
MPGVAEGAAVEAAEVAEAAAVAAEAAAVAAAAAAEAVEAVPAAVACRGVLAAGASLGYFPITILEGIMAGLTRFDPANLVLFAATRMRSRSDLRTKRHLQICEHVPTHGDADRSRRA